MTAGAKRVAAARLRRDQQAFADEDRSAGNLSAALQRRRRWHRGGRRRGNPDSVIVVSAAGRSSWLQPTHRDAQRLQLATASAHVRNCAGRRTSRGSIAKSIIARHSRRRRKRRVHKFSG